MTTSPQSAIPDRYQVLETLSENEAEIVCRCKDRTLGREVLIKLPGAAMQAAPELSTEDIRDLREARALAQIDHPNVQKLLEAIETPGGVLLVLEMVVGESLADRLERDVRLASEDVARIGTEIADALVAVHSIGAVHRDLSARNVTLRPDGSACLSGFRLAKFTVWAAAASTIGLALDEVAQGNSEDAALLPDHPAPEQFAGEMASARSDLFALGCVLYGALTGETPYPNMLEQGMSPPTEPHKLVPETPKALSKAIMSCLARSPVGRVQSATLLRDALRSVSEAPAGGSKIKVLAPIAAGILLLSIGLFFGSDLFGSKVDGGQARGIAVSDLDESLAGSVYSPTINKSYALLIGIGNAYKKNGLAPLPNASRDVLAMAKMLESLPREWEVELLTEERATHDGIMAAKSALEAKLVKNDRALIFYAGHGMAHDKSKESGWIVPADGQTLVDDPNRLKWIRYDEFKHFFDEAEAKHILILMDCCYSGRFAKERSAGTKPFEQRYLQRQAHVVITSGRGNEPVLDGEVGSHSPFAKAFMNAITNSDEAAITSSMIYSEILKDFTRGRITQEAEQYYPDPTERGQFVFFLE